MPSGTGKALYDRLFSRHEPGVLAVLRESAVGIAGAGGLGSNAAVSLARAGVGRLIVADFDRIEPSNLNRQQYLVSQIGRAKAAALRENLKAVNPFCECLARRVRITRRNVGAIFGEAGVLIEALDGAEEKSMLIRAWLSLFPDRPIISASGLAGCGSASPLRVRRIGNLYVCGDQRSECPPGISPMAPRVALVANMQADLAVRLLLKKTPRPAR